MAHSRRAKVKDPAKAFISTWRTSTVYTGSTANNQIKLPLEVAGTYKFTVNWGDGSSNVITTWNQAEVTHTYATPGDYTVTITGFIKGWDWGGGANSAPTTGDMRKLLTITQFGCLRLVSHSEYYPVSVGPIWGTFYGCTNLTLTGVQDIPNFKGTTSTFGFLRGCTSITNIPNINKWDVSKIQVFRSMLRDMPTFNENVGNWNTSNATSFIALFNRSTSSLPVSTFNNGGSASINNWNTSNVTAMGGCFSYQPFFNQPLGNWDTSKVIDMTQMFFGCISFNQNIGSWNTSKVTSMQAMLFAAYGNPQTPPYGTFNNGGSDSIKNWDVSKVTDMQTMFGYQPNFNQPIGSWNTSSLIRMDYMFYATVAAETSVSGVFNKDISNWNTSKVTNMRAMFFNQNSFNQPLNNWDTSKVTLMDEVFRLATNFNQPINNWNVSLVTNFTSFMLGKTNLNYSAANYDALLISWAARPVKPNLSINFGTIKYTAAATAARAILTSAPNNWTIVDGGLVA